MGVRIGSRACASPSRSRAVPARAAVPRGDQAVVRPRRRRGPRLFVGGAAGLLDEMRQEEIGAYRSLMEVLEKRAALLDVLAQRLDPRRPFARVGEELEQPGVARAGARRCDVRGRAPHARRGQPARAAPDGLRQGAPFGAVGRAVSSRGSSRTSTRDE